MAMSTTTGLPFPAEVSPDRALSARSNRRRSIDRASGRALEILGHAIEYLTDELVHSGNSVNASDPQIEAIQLLMSVNRQIYLQSPEVKPFGERCRSLLRLGCF